MTYYTRITERLWDGNDAALSLTFLESGVDCFGVQRLSWNAIRRTVQ